MSRAEDLFDRLVQGGKSEVLSFISLPVTEGFSSTINVQHLMESEIRYIIAIV
jgi:hypothetical protein